jgi:hypothetical protein
MQRTDRITVIYTLDFSDATDRAIAKVVAQVGGLLCFGEAANIVLAAGVLCLELASLVHHHTILAPPPASHTQEFEDSSRRVAGGAPPASFAALAAPQEIKDLVPAAAARSPSLVGWLSLSVFATHLDSPAKFDNAVTQLVMLRAFLDYHIKAAKSYLHMRMRNRIDTWLQVLNRAQPDEPFKDPLAGAAGAVSPGGGGAAASASSGASTPTGARGSVASARF